MKSKSRKKVKSRKSRKRRKSPRFNDGLKHYFDDWTEIKNNGQHNCGIFLHKKDPNLIMKCGTTKSTDVEEINKKFPIFPQEYYDEEMNGKKYLVMERLDNDITHIFFEILPNIVLETMKLDKDTTEDIKTVFDIKTPYTFPENHKIIITTQQNILASISRNDKMTLELYETFIHLLQVEWAKFHKLITREICILLTKLISIGYEYEDMKFDNFGYKLRNEIDDTYYRKDVPFIFGKFLYVKILDPESGLSKIKDSEKIKSLEKIISKIKDGFYLSAHGQYALQYLNEYVSTQDYYSDQINKILEKNYSYDFIPFKDEITDIFTFFELIKWC